MRIHFHGASVTAQSGDTGYYGQLSAALPAIDLPHIQLSRSSYGASHFDQAGYHFLSDAIKCEPDICFLEWATTSAKSLDVQRMKAAMGTLIAADILPIWMILPRADDLSGSRQSVAECISISADWGLPVLDATEIITSTEAAEILLRDVVHTNAVGAKAYSDFISSRLPEFCAKKSELLSIARENLIGLAQPAPASFPLEAFAAFVCDLGHFVEAIEIPVIIPEDGEVELLVQGVVGPYSPLFVTRLIQDEGVVASFKGSLFDPWCYYERSMVTRLFRKAVPAGAYSLRIELLTDDPRLTIPLRQTEKVPFEGPRSMHIERASAVNMLPANQARKFDFIIDMDIDSFKPSYVWPNPAFPFRVYFDGPRCRIFIIENIQHNWVWMREWHKFFKPTDHFLVLCGWYHSPKFASEAETIFSLLNLDRMQFTFLFNSPQEKLNFESKGFFGELINQNAWLDESIVMRPLAVEKLYRALYVGRRSAFKRHMLAANVGGLALIAGNNHGNSITQVPEHVYINDAPLLPEEVCLKINQAHCGLILSAEEGGCFASSEYLLCGVPVVSTPSQGGRQEWYNEYNAIVCEPTPEAVAAAVDTFCKSPRDPQKIRAAHIAQAEIYRAHFIALIGRIFDRYGVTDVNPAEYFRKNFFHKMRRSNRPDFSRIFQ